MKCCICLAPGIYIKPIRKLRTGKIKAKELFPNAVMLRVSYNINELEICPLTAYLVGLTDEYEKWYWWFQPSDYK